MDDTKPDNPAFMPTQDGQNVKKNMQKSEGSSESEIKSPDQPSDSDPVNTTLNRTEDKFQPEDTKTVIFQGNKREDSSNRKGRSNPDTNQQENQKEDIYKHKKITVKSPVEGKNILADVSPHDEENIIAKVKVTDENLPKSSGQIVLHSIVTLFVPGQTGNRSDGFTHDSYTIPLNFIKTSNRISVQPEEKVSYQRVKMECEDPKPRCQEVKQRRKSQDGVWIGTFTDSRPEFDVGKVCSALSEQESWRVSSTCWELSRPFFKDQKIIDMNLEEIEMGGNRGLVISVLSNKSCFYLIQAFRSQEEKTVLNFVFIGCISIQSNSMMNYPDRKDHGIIFDCEKTTWYIISSFKCEEEVASVEEIEREGSTDGSQEEQIDAYMPNEGSVIMKEEIVETPKTPDPTCFRKVMIHSYHLQGEKGFPLTFWHRQHMEQKFRVSRKIWKKPCGLLSESPNHRLYMFLNHLEYKDHNISFFGMKGFPSIFSFRTKTEQPKNESTSMISKNPNEKIGVLNQHRTRGPVDRLMKAEDEGPKTSDCVRSS